MKPKIAQIACPNCRANFILSSNGNAIAAPLICRTCGQAFLPHFYCPDVSSPARHIFTASTLYIDGAGKAYAFCPEHTFTTYAVAAENRPRQGNTSFRAIVRFFDSLAFRMALTIESWRWRLASRR
ncbi:MAG: hypothetical protein COS37_00160 [Anaerolineae bacterium CG03_land_8_20_14_0_80_58_20]|nr:MAG: hypothetical protein COS37_00160 [Anaerolineae bacterium CG03_land_8_20_14_0_80_58_20]